MITLSGHAFVMPHSLAGLPFYPALAVAVLGVLYVLAGRNWVLAFKRPVNISSMRDIAAGHDLIEPVKPLRALPRRYSQVREGGAGLICSSSNSAIFVFNSVSVISLSVRNGTGDGAETVPTASLLAMIFLLRFLTLLVQRYPLSHGRSPPFVQRC